jgi:hypothetical protein
MHFLPNSKVGFFCARVLRFFFRSVWKLLAIFCDLLSGETMHCLIYTALGASGVTEVPRLWLAELDGHAQCPGGLQKIAMRSTAENGHSLV